MSVEKKSINVEVYRMRSGPQTRSLSANCSTIVEPSEILSSSLVLSSVIKFSFPQKSANKNIKLRGKICPSLRRGSNIAPLKVWSAKYAFVVFMSQTWL